jgi:hypothetical protein
MSKNLKVYSEMSRKQFAKEIGRTLVVGTASSTAVYLGLVAVGYILVKLNELKKSHKED